MLSIRLSINTKGATVPLSFISCSRSHMKNIAKKIAIFLLETTHMCSIIDFDKGELTNPYQNHEAQEYQMNFLKTEEQIREAVINMCQELEVNGMVSFSDVLNEFNMEYKLKSEYYDDVFGVLFNANQFEIKAVAERLGFFDKHGQNINNMDHDEAIAYSNKMYEYVVVEIVREEVNKY